VHGSPRRHWRAVLLGAAGASPSTAYAALVAASITVGVGECCYTTVLTARASAGFLSSPTDLDVPASPGLCGPASRKTSMDGPEGTF
jgi:hypothetical protein